MSSHTLYTPEIRAAVLAHTSAALFVPSCDAPTYDVVRAWLHDVFARLAKDLAFQPFAVTRR